MTPAKQVSHLSEKVKETLAIELLKKLSANGIKIKPSLLKIYKRLTIFVSLFLVVFSANAQTEITSFKAAFTGTKAKLMWQASHTGQYNYFSIEKSWDGKNFETIGLVKQDGGMNDYIFYDKDYFSNVVYYRLLGNNNGKEMIIANIAAIQFHEDSKEFAIYPIITLTGSLYVDISTLTGEKIIVDAKDSDNILIASKSFEENLNETAFEVQSFHQLPKGEYTISAFFNEKVIRAKVSIDEATKNTSVKSKSDLVTLK